MSNDEKKAWIEELVKDVFREEDVRWTTFSVDWPAGTTNTVIDLSYEQGVSKPSIVLALTPTAEEVRTKVRFQVREHRRSRKIRKKQPCLKCGDTLYETTSLDLEGNPALLVGDAPKMEFDGTDYYLVCPHCGAKNVLVMVNNPGDLPRLMVSHVKKVE